VPRQPLPKGGTMRGPSRRPRNPNPAPVLEEPGETPRAESLESGVGSAIARNVRQYRNQLGLTAEQLAERSGISKGMLSKIENAQASPSLGTLVRLADAISVPLTALFRGLAEEHDALVVRAGQGVEIVRRGTRVGHRYELLGDMRGPHKVMEPVLVTLNEHSEVFPLFQHAGVEFIYMLDGAVEYGHGGDRYLLERGDAMQFRGEVVHGPTRLVQLPIRFLSIIAYGGPG
jgi:transcriptional regulator with XRE-family HTH domain